MRLGLGLGLTAPTVLRRGAEFPPAPAVAVGFTTLSFFDDFDDPETVDLDDTNGVGFKWYTAVGNGQGHTPSANISVAGSILKLGSTAGTGRAQVISAISIEDARWARMLAVLSGRQPMELQSST